MIGELGVRDAPGGCVVPVRVHPGAKRDAVTGTHDGAVKIALTSPPVDGRANEALVAFVAKRLGVARGQVTLLTGASSRMKTLRVVGLSAEEVSAKLLTELA
ncbi:DUF167 domain-containing protein [Granulicella sp. 5B5]|uniref:DUF167 domain-containing protein n=1 Tax=Granulicella sp. 5B5 TaxID=1617967 RepID=UPI002102DA42|nr:DUF167 domain-containing protein [Granulicella sp. 5B5]